MTIEVKGLAETLRELGKVEPDLRRTLNREIRNVVKPLVDDINSRIPGDAPLSGMEHQGRTGWANRKTSVIKLDARRPRRNINATSTTKPVSVVRITTRSAPVAIVDMAGKAGGTKSRRDVRFRRPNFSTELAGRLGDPSRFMWRDIENRLGPTLAEMEKVVAEVVRQANQELMKVRR
jgi:hypothetical protein